jgi:predicted O-methyltransferase YrrM
MNKPQKLFRAIAAIIQKPYLLNHVLEAPELHRDEFTKKYGMNGLPFTDVHPFLEQSMEVNPFVALDGGSTPIDLALLKSLAQRISECAYFEIGTWRGESVANVSPFAKECVTLDLSAEQMREQGAAEEYISRHDELSRSLSNVRHIKSDSRTFDYSTFNKKYDLIFVDGDHRYDAVVADTRSAFQLLKDDSSVIVWHDAGNHQSDQRWEVIHGILDGTEKNKRSMIYRVSNTLCAIFMNKQLPEMKTSDYPAAKNIFSLKVSLK